MKEKVKIDNVAAVPNKNPTNDGSSKTLTILGSETIFQGTLSFTDDLVIAGQFQGLINATGNLEISKGATCAVERISANSVISSGSILPLIKDSDEALPEIIAPTLVELCSGSQTTANIKTGKIRIEDDTTFTGNVFMSDAHPNENIFEVTSEEYRRSLIPTHRGIE